MSQRNPPMELCIPAYDPADDPADDVEIGDVVELPGVSSGGASGEVAGRAAKDLSAPEAGLIFRSDEFAQWNRKRRAASTANNPRPVTMAKSRVYGARKANGIEHLIGKVKDLEARHRELWVVFEKRLRAACAERTDGSYPKSLKYYNAGSGDASKHYTVQREFKHRNEIGRKQDSGAIKLNDPNLSLLQRGFDTPYKEWLSSPEIARARPAAKYGSCGYKTVPSEKDKPLVWGRDSRSKEETVEYTEQVNNAKRLGLPVPAAPVFPWEPIPEGELDDEALALFLKWAQHEEEIKKQRDMKHPYLKLIDAFLGNCEVRRMQPSVSPHMHRKSPASLLRGPFLPGCTRARADDNLVAEVVQATPVSYTHLRAHET